jgi:hypothetical protein
LPNKPFNFLCLRHLRLELNFVSLRKKRTDVLDLACLLEVAPLMENLEVHVSYIFRSDMERTFKCMAVLSCREFIFISFADVDGL